MRIVTVIEIESGLLDNGMFDNTDCGHPSYYTVHIHWITI